MAKHNLMISWCVILFSLALIGAILSMVDSEPIYYYFTIYSGVGVVFLCCPFAYFDSKLAHKQETKEIKKHYQKELDSKNEELEIRRTELEIERKRLELEKEKLAMQGIQTSSVKICEHCYQKLDSNAIICPYCGNDSL